MGVNDPELYATGNMTTGAGCDQRTAADAPDGGVGPHPEFYAGAQANCNSFGWENCPALGCRFDTPTWSCEADPTTQGASLVEGTDAYQMYPGLKESDEPYIFLDQTYRKFKIVHTGNEKFHGIHTGRWEFHQDTFAAAADVPANAGWLQNITGLMNLTRAQGAPIYVSRPLFDGSPAADLVDLPPTAAWMNKTSWFLFEPWTGMGLTADINLQISLEVGDFTERWADAFFADNGAEAAGCGECTRKHCRDGCYPYPPNTTDGRPFSQGLRHAYYPMVNIHQHVTMKDHKISKLKSKAMDLINFAQGMHHIGAPILLVFGTLQVLIGSFQLWQRKQIAREFDRCQEKVAEFERLLKAEQKGNH